MGNRKRLRIATHRPDHPVRPHVRTGAVPPQAVRIQHSTTRTRPSSTSHAGIQSWTLDARDGDERRRALRTHRQGARSHGHRLDEPRRTRRSHPPGVQPLHRDATSHGDPGGRVKSTPAQNEAYRASLCIGLCGRRYSAGRPRCAECHADQPLAVIEPELDRKGARRGTDS